MTDQLISAVIPVYNGAAFVAEAVESVLRQTYQPVECIVVDDGSTDSTPRVLDALTGIRIERQRNLGVSAARNRGVQVANGSFIAFLDADDVWLESKLERQFAIMHARAADLVYTGIKVVDEELRPILNLPAPSPQRALENTLLMGSPVMSLAQTGLFRADALRCLGGFNERMSTSADADLACRASVSMRIEAVEDCLVLYRRHPDQMHSDLQATEHDMSLLYTEFFANNPDLAKHYEARARASLDLTIAAGSWRRHDKRGALVHLARALVRHPPAACRFVWASARRAQAERAHLARLSRGLDTRSRS